MLNDWKGWEDSTAVGVRGEKILHFRAEPSEESESRDASPLSLGARSVMVMVRRALCLGRGASLGSTGALRVRGAALGAGGRIVERPAWSSARSMLSCVCRDCNSGVSGVVFGWEGQSLLRAECSSWQLAQHATEEGQQARTGRRLPPLGQEGLGQRFSALVWESEQKGQTGSVLGQLVGMWPNFQHFLHWEFLEEENICSTLRFPEKRLMEGRMAKVSGGAMVTTTEVLTFHREILGRG